MARAIIITTANIVILLDHREVIPASIVFAASFGTYKAAIDDMKPSEVTSVIHPLYDLMSFENDIRKCKANPSIAHLQPINIFE